MPKLEYWLAIITMMTASYFFTFAIRDFYLKLARSAEIVFKSIEVFFLNKLRELIRLILKNRSQNVSSVYFRSFFYFTTNLTIATVLILLFKLFCLLSYLIQVKLIHLKEEYLTSFSTYYQYSFEGIQQGISLWILGIATFRTIIGITLLLITTRQNRKLSVVEFYKETLLEIGAIVIAFAIDYTILLLINENSFSLHSTSIIKTFINFIYFSLVTISTIGYGDILPLTIKAKLLVCVEVINAFVLIAIVLTNFGSIRKKES